MLVGAYIFRFSVIMLHALMLLTGHLGCHPTSMLDLINFCWVLKVGVWGPQY